MSQEELEKIQTELEKETERKKKPVMPVSGRSVFELQKIMNERAQKEKKDRNSTDC